MYRFSGVVCQLSYDRSEITESFDDIDQALADGNVREATELLSRMEARLMPDVQPCPPDWLDQLVNAYEALFYLRRRLAGRGSRPDPASGRPLLPS